MPFYNIRFFYLFNWHMYSPLDCIPAVCSIHFSTAPKPSIWIYGYKSNTNYCNSIKRCLWVGFRHKKSLINTEVYNRHVCEVHLWIFVDYKINTKVIVLDSFADMLGAKKKTNTKRNGRFNHTKRPSMGPQTKAHGNCMGIRLRVRLLTEVDICGNSTHPIN